jgi:hypothetical protein
MGCNNVLCLTGVSAMKHLTLTITLCLVLWGCGSVEVVNNQPDVVVSTSCASDADCASSIACQVGTCNINAGSCNYTVMEERCLINDVCYNTGQQEPSVPCNVCDPELNEFAFVKKQCEGEQSCDANTGECAGEDSPVCGNSVIEAGEACDDSNAEAADGCDAACAVEAGWECLTAGSPCTDIDECAADAAPCDANATCTNSDGSYACACGEGFEGDGTACTDIDECAADAAPCDANATCTNSDGSYTCACNEGFEGDGTACTDIDACAADPAPCDANATCTNSDGTYVCACHEGWDGDGVTCTKGDPCDPNPCQNDGTCTDEGEGTYKCACAAGFEGQNCGKAIDYCAPNPCENDGVCSADAEGNITCTCALGFAGETCSEVLDYCTEMCTSILDSCGGGTPDGFVEECIVECSALQSGSCANEFAVFEACNPMNGAWICDGSLTPAQCSSEWFNMVDCAEETDVCADNPCQNGGKCIADGDTFSCQCPDGFSGPICEVAPANPCDDKPCQNGGICISTEDSFFCECPKDFEGALCQAPVCPGDCGDVNQNGDLDGGDYETLLEIVKGGAEYKPCHLATGDLKGDGKLTTADLMLMELVFEKIVTPECGLCKEPCGDIDGDGKVTDKDYGALKDLLNSEWPWGSCLYWRADVDGSGWVDKGDASYLGEMIETGIKGNCLP